MIKLYEANVSSYGNLYVIANNAENAIAKIKQRHPLTEVGYFRCIDDSETILLDRETMDEFKTFVIQFNKNLVIIISSSIKKALFAFNRTFTNVSDNEIMRIENSNREVIF